MSLDNVGVVFGGPSPEHDVSVLTGLQAARELAGSSKHRSVVGIYWSTSGDWFSVAPDLEASAFAGGVPQSAVPLRLVASPGGGFVGKGSLGRDKPIPLDCVINACHGGPGEDGTLQGVLDLAGIPYGGPSVAGAALGMDKWAFGAAMKAVGLPTLERQLLSADAKAAFDGPYIVKPRFGGSSIGIDVVSDWETAKARLSSNPHLRRGAVVEPYRPDLFDLNIAMTTWPELNLSAIEKPLRQNESGEILGYADKYVGGEGMVSAPRELPAKISGALESQVRDIAGAVSELCQVRGVARLDFLSDGTSVFVNELNTIPGSLSKHLWIEPALPFGELLARLLSESQARPTALYSTQGADGLVLRKAGSIAGKLG